MKERISEIPIVKEHQVVNALSCPVSAIPAAIPPHGSYRCPAERWLYLNGEGMVVGQGIVFDGVAPECYLVLAKVNGGRKWVWASAAPRHESRKLIWKL